MVLLTSSTAYSPQLTVYKPPHQATTPAAITGLHDEKITDTFEEEDLPATDTEEVNRKGRNCSKYTSIESRMELVYPASGRLEKNAISIA